MNILSTSKSIMVFTKRSKCPLGNTLGLNQVFLFLILSTVTFLILSNIGWLPIRLFRAYIQTPNVIPVMFRSFLTNESETEFGEIQPELKNCSCPKTTQPETMATEQHQKGPFIYDYIINEPKRCKDSVPFLIFLITTQRWQKEARQAIRQTWGKVDFLTGVNVLRIFLLGRDTKCNEDAQQSLLEESQTFHDIIQQNYLDTYNNLTMKVLMGLNWAATYCAGASYIMKTDSDMFINTEHLINSVLKPDQPPRLNFFTGYLMDNAKPIRSTSSKWYVSPEEYPEEKYPAFCSGTGYVFSAGLASQIVSVSPSVRWLHLEDVYVGTCLEQLGVKPVAPPKDTDFNIWQVPYTDCGYNKIVTSHGFSPGQIISYWNQLQSNKHGCNDTNKASP